MYSDYPYSSYLYFYATAPVPAATLVYQVYL